MNDSLAELELAGGLLATGSDTYEVVLEIDRETIGYLLKTARVAA